MWPFKKKKMFKITWRYCAYPAIMPSTECVKAVDISKAWRRIRKQHISDITLISWEEIE